MRTHFQALARAHLLLRRSRLLRRSMARFRRLTMSSRTSRGRLVKIVLCSRLRWLMSLRKSSSVHVIFATLVPSLAYRVETKRLNLSPNFGSPASGAAAGVAAGFPAFAAALAVALAAEVSVAAEAVEVPVAVDAEKLAGVESKLNGAEAEYTCPTAEGKNSPLRSPVSNGFSKAWWQWRSATAAARGA
jgi:hypothetical protein